jgi:hypothetical protein
MVQIYKNLIASLLLITSLSQAMKVSNLQQEDLFHANGKFHIVYKDQAQVIDNHWVDKPLRGIDQEKLKKFLKNGYISVHKMDNGEFNLKSNMRITGGGVGGATVGFYAGKFSVYFVGHGAMYIAALCTGPAFPVTLAALESTFIVPLEAASNAAGLAGGMVGGVATGPV